MTTPATTRGWRALVVFVLGVSVSLFPTGHVDAMPPAYPHPPRLIDAATFDRLLGDVRSEPPTDGKLERVRAIASGRAYVFTGGQVVALLDAFTFWIDRVQALGLLPLVDGGQAARDCRYFDPAPATIRADATRILGLGK